MNNVVDIKLHDLEKTIQKIDVHDHLCLIYETQEEQFSAVIPFIKIGLERGEKCLYVVDDNTAAMVINKMKTDGIDVEVAVGTGKLTIASKQDSYLKQGYFDPDWMINFLKQATDEAIADGFPALRITGEMTWVLGGDPGTERLFEYEAKLNYFFPKNEAIAICQYNRNRFSSGIIRNVIATHPLVIYGGMVCKNFYYIPPDVFLYEEQPAKEIDRLLANIKNREKVETDLQLHKERLEELVAERTTELKRINERFSLAANAARLGIWDWDIQKNELIWDDMMYSLYGIKKENFTGAYEAWLQGVHPDDRAHSNEISRRAQHGEVEYNTEFRVVWPDGSIHYLKAYGKTIKDADGRPLRMTGVNFDITEQKCAEEERLQSEEKFFAAFHTSPDLISITRVSDGKILEANNGYEQLLGYTRSESVGKTTTELSIWADKNHRTTFITTLEKFGEVKDFETTLRRKDGSLVVVIDSARTFDLHGEACVLSVVHDITERKNAEKEIRKLNLELEKRVADRTSQLVAANKELENITYSIAHDLRSPLRGIDGYCQLLIDEYQDKINKQGKNYLQSVRSASQRMGQLLDDMLNLSRLSRGEINIQQVNLSEIAQQIADDLQSTQPERQVEFIVQDGMTVKGDGRLLSIVLEKLIGNAWKFTSKHPAARIEFGLIQKNEKPVYFVRDDGAGFNMEYVQKLFYPFQRLHNINEFPGTGVGLATVQRIIHRHGGEVWADGEIGKGATFYFTIP